MSNQLSDEINKYFESLNESSVDEARSVRSKQKGIYRFYCMIRYTDVDRSLESILTDIRALPSITIVVTQGETSKVSDREYIAALSIKYVPSPIGVPLSPERKKLEILQSLKKIQGIKRVFKVSSRIERFDV